MEGLIFKGGFSHRDGKQQMGGRDCSREFR